MKATVRIPTNDYAFIEIEDEFATEEDVVDLHDKLSNMVRDRSGLNVNEWAAVRRKLMLTGESDPNLREKMSKYQIAWIKDTNNTYRDIKHG